MKILLTVTALLLAFIPIAHGKLITGYGFKGGLIMGNQNPTGIFTHEYNTPDRYVFQSGVYSFEWKKGSWYYGIY